VRVVLADDSFLFREGVARLLTEAGFDVVGQAADAEQLDDVVRSKRPDVAVVDIRMPPSNTTEGLVAAKRIRAEFPEVGVLVFSHYVESDHAVDLLSDGAGHVGYLLKDRVSALDEFAEAVRRVGAGGSVIDSELVGQLMARRRETNALDLLTEREREVLSLMSEGRSNQAICEKLFLTPKTVESHVRSIFTKLGLLPAPDDHRRVLAVLTYLRS
jgi:DNA-binding NarL/FixJ family response regulator